MSDIDDIKGLVVEIEILMQTFQNDPGYAYIPNKSNFEKYFTEAKNIVNAFKDKVQDGLKPQDDIFQKIKNMKKQIGTK